MAPHMTIATGRDLHWIDYQPALLADAQRIEEVRANIAAGDIYIARRQFDPDLLRDVREYLQGVGRGSLPNYVPIDLGAPNFHRMNRNDSRAYVQGCFHQFVFFPWNQDPFDLFNVCAPIYHMKNRLSGLSAEKFLGAFVFPIEHQARLPAKQRGRVPVDNRADVVFVKTPAQSLSVDVAWFLLAPHQILIRADFELLAAGVQIPVLPPHGAPYREFRMLVIDVEIDFAVAHKRLNIRATAPLRSRFGYG